MPARKLRTAITLTTALAALAPTCVADAAMRQSSQATTHSTSSKTATTAKPTTTTTTSPRGGTTPVSYAVKGTATGKGPANQDDCDRWASGINQDMEASDEALLNDDMDMVDFYDQQAASGTLHAESKGCAIDQT